MQIDAVLTRQERLLYIATTVVAIVAVAHMVFVPLSANDFWLQVKIGEMIWRDHKIPETVLFTFTEVKDFPFHAHEWLSSVIFYLLYDLLGYDNLLFVKGAMGLAIFWLCHRVAFRWTSDFAVSLFLAVVTMMVINYRFFMRPEIFALLFIVLLLNLLTEYQITRKRRYLIWIIPLSMIWANCHGTFPLALMITGLCGVGEGIGMLHKGRQDGEKTLPHAAFAVSRPYLLCCVAIFLATLVNPYGLQLYVFAWDFSRWTVTRVYILEWRSTFSDWFIGTRGFWAYTYCLLLCGVILIRFRKVLSLTDGLLLTAFGYLSADRSRYIALFGMILPYVLARLIRTGGPAIKGGRMTYVLLLVLGAAGTAFMIEKGNQQHAYPYFSPSENFTLPLIDYVKRSGIHGNTLNSYSLGAELIQKFYPALRPSIDSRIDAYGEQYFLVHDRIFYNENLLAQYIDRYNVRVILLKRDEFELIQNMPFLKKTGWRMLFADQKAVLLGKENLEVEGAATNRKPVLDQ